MRDVLRRPSCIDFHHGCSTLPQSQLQGAVSQLGTQTRDMRGGLRSMPSHALWSPFHAGPVITICV